MTADDVERTIAEVRHYYFRSAKSLRDHQTKLPRGGYRPGERQTLRLQRKFADPQNGYSPDDLEELIASFRSGGYALGTSFLGRLVAVPKGRARDRLAAAAIKKEWTLDQFRAAIRRAGVTRARPGQGRTVRPPENLAEALERIEQDCPAWAARLAAMMPGDGDSPVELPATLKREVRAAKDAIRKLEKAARRLRGRRT